MMTMIMTILTMIMREIYRLIWKRADDRGYELWRLQPDESETRWVSCAKELLEEFKHEGLEASVDEIQRIILDTESLMDVKIFRSDNLRVKITKDKKNREFIVERGYCNSDEFFSRSLYPFAGWSTWDEIEEVVQGYFKSFEATKFRKGIYPV